MKTNSNVVRAGAVLSWGVGLLWLGLACKDDDPCDTGYEEHGAAACYPVAMAGTGGSPGGGGSAGTPGTAGTEDPGEQTDAGDGGAPPPAPAVEAEAGDPCTDDVAFSDCGGAAPICALLMRKDPESLGLNVDGLEAPSPAAEKSDVVIDDGSWNVREVTHSYVFWLLLFSTAAAGTR